MGFEVNIDFPFIPFPQSVSLIRPGDGAVGDTCVAQACRPKGRSLGSPRARLLWPPPGFCGEMILEEDQPVFQVALVDT